MKQIAFLLALAPAFVLAADKPLIELKTSEETFVGKDLAHNGRQLWLMQRDGQLTQIDFKDVKSFRQVKPSFESYSAMEMKRELQEEFGREFQITGTTHYLICAAPGQGKAYGELFEQLYRDCYVHFSTRQYRMDKTTVPLVAIVFPTHKQFAAYARSEGIRNLTGLAGYYQPRTHRIAIFDPGTETASIERTQVSPFDQTPGSLDLFARASSIESGLKDTIIHEATHQVAFHFGLHSRIGETPKWTVEGLATVFENAESRQGYKPSAAIERVNRERYVWFQSYSKRRSPGTLESFLKSDALFQTLALDAYSEAWALTFFLMETRAAQHAKYLKRVADRDPLTRYSPEQRLADFKVEFGSDLAAFERQYLEFISKL